MSRGRALWDSSKGIYRSGQNPNHRRSWRAVWRSGLRCRTHFKSFFFLAGFKNCPWSLFVPLPLLSLIYPFSHGPHWKMDISVFHSVITSGYNVLAKKGRRDSCNKIRLLWVDFIKWLLIYHKRDRVVFPWRSGKLFLIICTTVEYVKYNTFTLIFVSKCDGRWV